MGTGIEQRHERDEVARLERWLGARTRRDPLGCTIRAADHAAVEAVAGRHGYRVRTAAVEEPGALWVEFRPDVGENPHPEW